jgi:hypothetical protein
MNQQVQQKQQNSTHARASCCQARQTAVSFDSDQFAQDRDGLSNHGFLLVSGLGILQAKLEVGAPDDEYEREADRVAADVVGMTGPNWSREDRQSEVPFKARSPISFGYEVSPELEARINSLRSGGRHLSEHERGFFEPRFGRDLTHVRVHSDTEVSRANQELRARGFTCGRDVFLGGCAHSTDFTGGTLLMAHELAHAIQNEGNPDVGRIQRQDVGTGGGTGSTAGITTVDLEKGPLSDERVQRAFAFYRKLAARNGAATLGLLQSVRHELEKLYPSCKTEEEFVQLVARYQRDRKLDIDGMVWEKTLTSMFDEKKAKAITQSSHWSVPHLVIEGQETRIAPGEESGSLGSIDAVVHEPQVSARDSGLTGQTSPAGAIGPTGAIGMTPYGATGAMGTGMIPFGPTGTTGPMGATGMPALGFTDQTGLLGPGGPTGGPYGYTAFAFRDYHKEAIDLPFYLSGGFKSGFDFFNPKSWEQFGREVKSNPQTSAKKTGETNDYSTFYANEGITADNFVNLMLGRFVTGVGPENFVFPLNGDVSNAMRESPIVENAIKEWYEENYEAILTHGRLHETRGGGFGLSEQLDLLVEKKGILNIPQFVGSATVTVEPLVSVVSNPNDLFASSGGDSLLVTIRNVTSATSGDILKHLPCFGTAPSFPKDTASPYSQPYTNISQKFQFTEKIIPRIAKGLRDKKQYDEETQ